MERIKLTQKELYSHIREAPTYEQAKSSIGKLAMQFLADVETANQELKEKRQEAEAERKALDAPSKWFERDYLGLEKLYCCSM